MRRGPPAFVRRAGGRWPVLQYLSRVPSARRRVRRTRRSQPIGAARCRCTQRLDGIGGRGGSLGGRCGRIGRSARRRSALWRTRAAAAHVGAHVCAGTSYACSRHAGRRRSAQCPRVPKGARVRGYSVSTVSTQAPLACVRCSSGGARARRQMLLARVCAGLRVPARVPALPCGAHYVRALRLSRARGLHFACALECVCARSLGDARACVTQHCSACARALQMCARRDRRGCRCGLTACGRVSVRTREGEGSTRRKCLRVAGWSNE
jgi:hypothetical protein